ncbi:MAG: 1-deoxy-D-xylulose-5-phosphate reductoisomerase [bacterium]
MSHSERNLAIFGSTGSIGRQALEVIEKIGGFRIAVLSAFKNWKLLSEQTIRWQPEVVVLGDSSIVPSFKGEVKDRWQGDILVGENGLIAVCQEAKFDLALNALVGTSGLMPSYYVLRRGIALALANKESLVLAGEILMRLAEESSALIIPVDSEHCALFQCLRGERREEVRRVIITASGGPFRNRLPQEVYYATPQEALSHPTWQMGPKITIDSATLMNKGLEVIEAHHLFGLPSEAIEVRIHPQSVIHSLVQFQDGSFKAQLSRPDMRLPIQFALTYPRRLHADYFIDDPVEWGALTFEPIPHGWFRCLDLAYQALQMGMTYPAVLNGSDEAAVELFLKGAIPFGRIPELIEEALAHHQPISPLTIETVSEADSWAKEWVRRRVEKL